MNILVYILFSESLDKFYKGQTNDISDRIKRHNAKQEKATQDGVPWTLVWSIKKQSRSDAVSLERKLKNLSRNRLIDFMLKYPEGLASPDVTQMRKSGC